MIIYKPNWVVHADDKSRKSSLFTLSINPSGTKLATGGLDPQIRIWNVKPILDEAIHSGGPMCHKFSSSEPQLLSTLTRHTGSIMCLRWSPKGNYLASASDDTTVIVWALESHMQPSSRLSEILKENRNPAFETVSIEKYKVVQRLTRHQSDVTGLAWAPDQSQLASCGLDNMIYIWETAGFGCVRQISAHRGFVKGLAWDPIGHYLASHSDDGSMMIWRVKDWVLEHSSTEPFQHASGATYFQRPSWTPTGSHLVAANASNGSLPIAALLARSNWDSGLGLLGHAEPIEVASFNPVVFCRPSKKASLRGGDIFETDHEDDAEPDVPLIYCALGSQDRSVSLWRNNSSRPLVVIQDLFEHSVMDLCWSTSGSCLFAASYDGSVAVVVLQAATELGLACSAREKERLLSKYGPIKDDIDLPASVAEYVERENKRTAKEQEEQQALVEPPLALSVDDSQKSQPQLQRPLPLPQHDSPSSSVESTIEPLPARASHAAQSSQIVTITRDGKRRIQPQLLVGGASPVLDRSAKSAAPSVDDRRSRKHAEAKERPGPNEALSQRNRIARASELLPNTARAVRVAKRPAKKAKFVHHLCVPEQRSSPDDPALLIEVQGNVMSLIRDRLVEWTLALPLTDLRIVAGNRNYILCGGLWSHLSTSDDSQDDNGSKGAGGGERGTEAAIGQLLFLSTESGRALCPPVFLDSPICHLAVAGARGSFACALTLHGGLYLWNLAGLKNLTPAPTFNGLLRVLLAESCSLTEGAQGTKRPTWGSRTHSPSVLVSHLSLGGKKSNVPLIHLTNDTKYLYHLDMNAWMKLESFPLSDFLPGEPTQNTDRLNQMRERLAEGSGMLPRRLASLAHAEHQLSLASMLESAEEYLQWFRIYIKRACEEKAICKLLDILKQVFGPCSVQTTQGFGPGFLNSYFDQHALMSDDSCDDAFFVSAQLGIPKSRFAKEALPVLKGLSADDPRIVCWIAYLDSFKV